MDSIQSFKCALRLKGLSKSTVYSYCHEMSKIISFYPKLINSLIANPESVCWQIKSGVFEIKHTHSTCTAIRHYAKIFSPNYRAEFALKCHGFEELTDEDRELINKAIEEYNSSVGDNPIEGFKVERGCCKITFLVKVAGDVLEGINLLLDAAQSIKEHKEHKIRSVKDNFFDFFFAISEIVFRNNLTSLGFVNDDYLKLSLESAKLLQRIISQKQKRKE